MEKCQVLTEKEYHEAEEKYGKGSFKAQMGAEALKKLLEEIDLDKLSASIKKDIEKVFKILHENVECKNEILSLIQQENA